MSKSRSENVIPFVLLLVSVSPFTEKSLVFGSSISERIAKRSDPLQKFRHYGGSYDITNKHYWASAAFTGIHGNAVAGILLLSGVGLGVFVVVKNSSRSTPSIVDGHPNSSNLIMLLLVALFTLFAITASSVVIAANQKTLKRAEKLEKTIFDGGDDAFRSIGRVKATLRHMHALLLPYDSKTCNLLDFVGHRLRRESLNIQSVVAKTRRSCDRALKTLYLVNLVVVSVNLVLLVAGIVLLAFQHRPGILVLIFSCWILTTLTWVLTGVDFFFYTFIGDTCSTMKNFEEDPKRAGFRKCFHVQSPQILKEFWSKLITINSKIREVLELSELHDDQSVPEVCDPFSSAPDYSYSPENCGKSSVPVGDLPRILSRFICYKENSSENCVADGRFLPEAMYPISLAYSQSIQELIKMYPDLSSLLKCSSVKQAFADIVKHQCRPMKVSTYMLWSSALTLSVVMVILVLLWSNKAIEDGGKCLSWWSIFR